MPNRSRQPRRHGNKENRRPKRPKLDSTTQVPEYAPESEAAIGSDVLEAATILMSIIHAEDDQKAHSEDPHLPVTASYRQAPAPASPRDATNSSDLVMSDMLTSAKQGSLIRLPPRTRGVTSSFRRRVRRGFAQRSDAGRVGRGAASLPPMPLAPPIADPLPPLPPPPPPPSPSPSSSSSSPPRRHTAVPPRPPPSPSPSPAAAVAVLTAPPPPDSAPRPFHPLHPASAAARARAAAWAASPDAPVRISVRIPDAPPISPHLNEKAKARLVKVYSSARNFLVWLYGTDSPETSYNAQLANQLYEMARQAAADGKVSLMFQAPGRDALRLDCVKQKEALAAAARKSNEEDGRAEKDKTKALQGEI